MRPWCTLMNADQNNSMTSEDYAQLFALIDRAKRLHNYFLAELLPNRDKTEYTLRFLPGEDNVGSSYPTRCRYIHIDKAEALMAIQLKSLTPSMIESLDRELANSCDEM